MHRSPSFSRRIAVGVAFAFVLSAGAAQARSPEIYTGILSSTAVGGYDPVAYFKDGTPVAGKSDITWTWKGATWRFASAENREIFKQTRLLRLGGVARLHRQGRSEILEDRQRQALPELRRAGAEGLGKGHPGQCLQGRPELAGGAQQVRTAARIERTKSGTSLQTKLAPDVAAAPSGLRCRRVAGGNPPCANTSI
jgi:hypothetical protein